MSDQDINVGKDETIIKLSKDGWAIVYEPSETGDAINFLVPNGMDSDEVVSGTATRMAAFIWAELSEPSNANSVIAKKLMDIIVELALEISEEVGSKIKNLDDIEIGTDGVFKFKNCDCGEDKDEKS